MKPPPFTAPQSIDGERYDQYFQRLIKAFEDHVNGVLTSDLVAVSCDCDCGTPCPQGKYGSASRCTIMVRR